MLTTIHCIIREFHNLKKGTLSKIDQNTSTLVYTPNPGFTGTNSFNHKANDGKQDSNSGKVNIEVRGKK